MIWVHTDCPSILHVFILTEVEASALNCGHNELNVRVAQVEGNPDSCGGETVN